MTVEFPTTRDDLITSKKKIHLQPTVNKNFGTLSKIKQQQNTNDSIKI